MQAFMSLTEMNINQLRVLEKQRVKERPDSMTEEEGNRTQLGLWKMGMLKGEFIATFEEAARN